MDSPTGTRSVIDGGSSAPALVKLAMIGLYLIGGLQWADFFDYGRLAFTAYDWPKERLYLEVVRESLKHGEIPWHVVAPAAYIREFPQFANQISDGDQPACTRFLALPETVLSPQALLLRYLNPGRFVLVHFLLLYTAGFLGCLWFRRRFRLTFLPFAVLVILFNFNGYITSHLAVGHLMCGGYFFLPFVALFVLEWMENIRSSVPGIKLALVFLAMFLQGSLHMVVWCWLFLGLIVAWNPQSWRSATCAVILSGLLAGIRLVPAAFAYWNFKALAFGGGYPTLTTLAEALLVVREPTHVFAGGIFWWEYDLYVGVLGACVLAYSGLYRRFSRDPRFVGVRFRPLDVPLLLMVLFSLSDFFYPIFSLPLPLVNSERVTSRFIVIPFILLLFISTIRMQREINALQLGLKGVVVILVGVLVLWLCLLAHAMVWQVGHLEASPKSRWHELATPSFVDIPDRGYAISLWVGALVSLIGFGTWLGLCLRSRRPPKIG